MIQRYIPSKFLLPLGMLLLIAPMVAERYMEMPDFFYGLSVGCGIGLIVHFISSNKKQKTVVPDEHES